MSLTICLDCQLFRMLLLAPVERNQVRKRLVVDLEARDRDLIAPAETLELVTSREYELSCTWNHPSLIILSALSEKDSSNVQPLALGA